MTAIEKGWQVNGGKGVWVDEKESSDDFFNFSN